MMNKSNMKHTAVEVELGSVHVTAAAEWTMNPFDGSVKVYRILDGRRDIAPDLNPNQKQEVLAQVADAAKKLSHEERVEMAVNILSDRKVEKAVAV